MLPRVNSKNKSQRKVPVRPGKAHFRTIDEPIVGDTTISEKMTRSRIGRMPTEMQVEWKRQALQRILEFSPTKSDQMGITAILNRAPTAGAPGCSSDPLPPTQVGTPKSDVGSPKKKSKTGVPITPIGMTPSRRDGKNAPILAYSPWA
jgi:hypothetical protein